MTSDGEADLEAEAEPAGSGGNGEPAGSGGNGEPAGPVLARDGDFYGPTVNIASRIVNVARPGSVVTSGRVHHRLDGDDRFEWRTIRNRYLKDIGRIDLHVAHRRASAVDAALRITERARHLGEQHMRSLLPDTVRERYEDRVRERG